ncbi:MAG: hypothetical protein KGS48_00095 [Bacteroidetes bacterium]|nr:hypothetical protein [Bacteroidota bacterium]
MKRFFFVLIPFLGCSIWGNVPLFAQAYADQLPQTAIRLDIIPLAINSVNVGIDRRIDLKGRWENTFGFIYPNAYLQKNLFEKQLGRPDMLNAGIRIQTSYRWIRRSRPGGIAALRGLQFEWVQKWFNDKILFQKAPPPGTAADDYNLMLSQRRTQLGLRYEFCYMRGVKYCISYGFNFGVAYVHEKTMYGGVQRQLQGPYVTPVMEKEMLPRDNTGYIRGLFRVFLRAGIGFGSSKDIPNRKRDE